MTNININDFLSSLTEEQRAALLTCKTEEDFDRVIDDYDIELPDELLAEVAGGKGFIPTLLAAVMMLSSASAIAAGAESAPVQSDGGDTAVSVTYEEDISEGGDTAVSMTYEGDISEGGDTAVSVTYEGDKSEGGDIAASEAHEVDIVEYTDPQTGYKVIKRTFDDGHTFEVFQCGLYTNFLRWGPSPGSIDCYSQSRDWRRGVQATIYFDGIGNSSYITNKTVNIYGRRIIDMDDKGNYILSDVELLTSLSADEDGSVDWLFCGDIDLDSVRIEFRHTTTSKNNHKPKPFNVKDYLNSLYAGLFTQLDDIYLKDLIGDVSNTSSVQNISIYSGKVGDESLKGFSGTYENNCGGLKVLIDEVWDKLYFGQFGYVTASVNVRGDSDVRQKLVHNCEYASYVSNDVTFKTVEDQKFTKVENDDGSLTFIKEKFNHATNLWETTKATKPYSAADATICFNDLNGDIANREIRVYGKRVIDLDENGGFVYDKDNCELLFNQTFTDNDRQKFTLGADVDLSSVYIEFRNKDTTNCVYYNEIPKIRMVENDDGTVKIVKQEYNSKTKLWETTKEVSMAYSAVDNTICLNDYTVNLTEFTINVYGVRIIDIDENGNFIYGGLELLDSFNFDNDDRQEYTFGADVAFHNRRLQTIYKKTGGYSVTLLNYRG